jgi:indolepyruvate ferredoxin oxidoreductase beta subunit
MLKAGGNILFTGVGGQGILIASEVTALALIASGYDVKKSEVHGMAQRGGSVVAHLRYGKKVYSPLIEPGAADIEVAFEMLESVRYLTYLKKDAKVIVNIQRIFPLSALTGNDSYPEGILDELEGRGLSVFPLDASGIGRELGEPRAANMALAGALSFFLPVREKAFMEVIGRRLPERFLDVNTKAFEKGREMTARLIKKK